MPIVAESFARDMPRAKLRIVSPDFLVATDGLATGLIDAAFYPEQAVHAGSRGHVFFGNSRAKSGDAAFPLPAATTALVWHERTHTDGAQFFRDLVTRAVAPRERRKPNLRN